MSLKKLYPELVIVLLVMPSLIAMLLWLPIFIEYFLIYLVLIVCGLEFLKLILWIKSYTQFYSGEVELNDCPLVSIHLAICNENPEMVVRTIKSVLKQSYVNFELIIVDNNTRTETQWIPVKNFCETEKKIRFFHLVRWPFYKAGALNFAFKLTDSSADYIFVLDADYILKPNALEIAVSNIHGSSFALAQFPQSYQTVPSHQKPLLNEFDHFFKYYSYLANCCYGALATGTLSLIRKSVLKEVGGWPVNSITEDAQLGVLFQTKGLDVKFVNRVIGQGIAPTNQQDFIKQRKRWIFGNVQTLCGYTISAKNNLLKMLSSIAQLTAWPNMLGIPILTILAITMIYPWLALDMFITIGSWAYLSLWLFSVAKLIQVFLTHEKLLDGVKSFLVHFCIMNIGAFHWWPILWGHEEPFVRTDKNSQGSAYILNLFNPLLHLGILILSISEKNTFLMISSISFLILRIASMSFDFYCRNGRLHSIKTVIKFNQ